MLAVLALLFSGVVQAAISPPWNLLVLHPVAWVPAMWVIRRLRGGSALMAGWLVGMSANLTIFYWLPGTMIRFGDLPLPAALAAWLLFGAAMGFYAAIFAWGFGRIRAAAGMMWPVAIAAWFCALEFLNPQIFGYLQGHAWYQVPEVFLLSAVTGVSGVSFLVMSCNAVVLQGLEAFHERRLPIRSFGVNAAVLAIFCAAAVMYSHTRLQRIAEAEQRAPVLTVAVIQPDHTIERRRELSRMKRDAFARDLVALSQKAIAEAGGRKIDVFVWPEGALPTDPSQPENRVVLDFVRATGAEVWTGGNHEEGRGGSEHNSAFRIHPPGQIDRRYDKNILVPFGEYVPLRDVIPGFDRIRTVGSFEPGVEVPAYESGPARFVFSICYEAIHAGFVRSSLRPDTNLLVNVTVDAWYGDSSEQSQHLMLAAAQSATHGIPLVRSTTTGISAITDARGVLVARSGKFTREALVREVRPLRVPAPYTRWGEWLAWLCVAASVLLLAATLRLRQAVQFSSS
ncbi:MAG TPA: apolipoprotein N-acyltransferase [Candidatus Limnocylindrales bacterium]|nr:apolipoprotein N-acyltransferase [Candidatus Limnocylindrales bacterium]